VSGPYIPDIDPEADTLTGALAYAEAGLYVGPIRTDDSKHAGNVLGNDWPSKTSRDPKTIISWFAGRNLGVFIHVGRSGLWAADVDNPDRLHDVLASAITDLQPPFQSSRPDRPGRGHAVFAQPVGRQLGNSTGKLGKDWGEARGRNGIVVASPTQRNDGGLYRWLRTGLAPVLPASVADLLPEAGPGVGAVDDAALSTFLKTHTRADRPSLLTAVTNAFNADVEAGGSRHDAARNATCWAMREAACGFYPAHDAAIDIRDLYIAARSQDRDTGRDGVSEETARAEYRSILAYAIAQVDLDDLEQRRNGVNERAPDLHDVSWIGNDDSTVEQPAASRRHYFKDKVGLLVATLAEDILAIGPLADGADDIVWSYSDGVWTPDRHVVRERAAQLLGERYRRSHGSNAEDVIRARSSKITCEPISESINFRNGLYLWQADQLRPHDPNVMSTVQLAVDWNPEASCPAFDKFLSEVVPEDIIGLTWEAIGYLLYNGNPLHKAIMLMGSGRNGKGTLLRTITALIGAGNITAVSLHALVSNRFSTANLFGKLANIAGDIDGTYLESTATFKAITGQDRITAEHKGRDAFDFTPWAVPVFSANKIPASADVTVGYLSRWLVIPFPNDFTGREDRKLDARLQTKAELQGIAVKAVPPLRRLIERGDFDLPKSGEEARDEFTRRVDQVRTWVDECCDLDDQHPFEPRSWLYQKYRAWADRDGHKPVKASEFYDRVDSVPGCIPTRRHGGERGYLGLKVMNG